MGYSMIKQNKYKVYVSCDEYRNAFGILADIYNDEDYHQFPNWDFTKYEGVYNVEGIKYYI